MTEHSNEQTVDFEEVETKEDAPANNIEIDRGVVIYHAANGTQGYTFINKENVTLQDVAFYKRYLDQVEQHLWDLKGGLKHVDHQE